MDKRIKKYIGIDWGGARIGLALGDSETKIATPYKVVHTINEVLDIVKQEDIDIIIIGEPKKMQNSKFKTQNEFLEFFKLLKIKTNKTVNTIDERLSSKQADSLVGDKKTKASRDAIAAMLILQTYLDKK